MSRPTPTPMPAPTEEPGSQAEELSRLAMRIITARDASDEATAIQNLRRYETDNNLTYQTTAVRHDTNTVVNNASTNPYSLRVDVAIFKGQVPVYTFSFVPRDNRNLAMMGM